MLGQIHRMGFWSFVCKIYVEQVNIKPECNETDWAWFELPDRLYYEKKPSLLDKVKIPKSYKIHVVLFLQKKKKTKKKKTNQKTNIWRIPSKSIRCL